MFNSCELLPEFGEFKVPVDERIVEVRRDFVRTQPSDLPSVNSCWRLKGKVLGM